MLWKVSKTRYAIQLLLAVLVLAPTMGGSGAQMPGEDTFTTTIYHVNEVAYPIVQAYMRTWDDDREPVPNINIANIGLQVKGRNYNPNSAVAARQYAIQNLDQREEGFRTVFVLDASASMAGAPFNDALNALRQFIEGKRPNDQVAVLAIRDRSGGYEVVSRFETDPTQLYQRIGDVEADGQQTRLYDTVAAALEMCATALRGSATERNYPVLSTIVILSDGHDEGSVISRTELMNRIGQMERPIPIHSIAFTNIGREHLGNIEALSRATFGRYWDLEDTEYLGRTMQHIHRINRSDYVVMFRSYVPVDGESHTFRIGVEYPSGSGSFILSSAAFEAMDSPLPFTEEGREFYGNLLEQFPDNETAAFGDGDLSRRPPVDDQIDRWEQQQERTEVSGDVTGEKREPIAGDLDEEDNFLAAVMSFVDGADGMLLVAGGVILLLLLLTVAWVKRGSGHVAHSAASSGTTAPGAIRSTPHASETSTRSTDEPR